MAKKTKLYETNKKSKYYLVVDDEYCIYLGDEKLDLKKYDFDKCDINMNGNDTYVIHTWDSYFATMRGDYSYGEYGKLYRRKYEFYEDDRRINPLEVLKTVTIEETLKYQEKKDKERKYSKKRFWHSLHSGGHHAGCHYRSKHPKCIHYLREAHDEEQAPYIRPRLKSEDWSMISWDYPSARHSRGWKECGKYRHQWEKHLK